MRSIYAGVLFILDGVYWKFIEISNSFLGDYDVSEYFYSRQSE